jgi:hypothetical protein
MKKYRYRNCGRKKYVEPIFGAGIECNISLCNIFGTSYS